MSDSVGSIASGLEGVAQAVSGGVVIGGIRLDSFEVPEQINFGGAQALVQHKLIGGQRVIDVMGSDEADITWRGMMLGANAVSRARQLDQLRQAGATIPLLFGPFSRNVVISEFAAEYRRQNWIGSYTIKCVVVPTGTYNSRPGLLDGVLGDITAALGIDTSGLAAVGQTLAQVQSVAASVGTLIPGTPGVGSLLAVVNGAGNAVGAAQALAEGNVAAVIGRVSAVGNIGGSAAFASLLTGAKSLASAAGAAAYLGRAAANLTGAKG